MPEPGTLKLSLPLLRQVLDRLHHPVILLDCECLIVYANQAMLHYVERVTSRRWGPEQVVGLDVAELHPPHVRKKMKERVEAVLAGEPLPPRFNTVRETMFMTYDTALTSETGEIAGLMMEKIPVNLMSESIP